MSLKLLIDEDSQDKLLVAQLKAAGHDLPTVGDLDLLGEPEDTVLAKAIAEDRVFLTGNCDDFAALSARLSAGVDIDLLTTDATALNDITTNTGFRR